MLINLSEKLSLSCEKNPEKIALVSGNNKYSYDFLEKKSNKLANYLCKIGIQRGDRVVIALGNTLDTVLAFWATLKANAIVSIIHEEQPKEKIQYILKDSGAKVFFTIDANEMREFFQNEENKIHVISKNMRPFSNKQFSDIITDTNIEIPPQIKTIDCDLASIIYTSGSTGEPKGVMLTHRNMIVASESINSYLETSIDDKILNVLPMSFDYGLYQMILAFSVGATLILEKNFLLPSQTMRQIETEKITGLPLVPSMLNLILDFSKKIKYDFSSIKYITNTGAALSEKNIEELIALFPNARIFSMYGLTECKRCTYLPPADIRRKPTSVGIPIPNTEIWVVDENGKKLDANQIGQLVVRGATVMQGYWNKPEKTAEKIKPGLLPNENILYTGDYALIDEDGYLYFKGRMDEVIKSRGYKVSPKEIEEIILKYPSVKEVAAIGKPDNVLGESISVFIVAESGSKIDSHEIEDWCKKNLDSYKIPKEILFVKSFQKSNNGKIDKKILFKNLYNIENNHGN